MFKKIINIIISLSIITQQIYAASPSDIRDADRKNSFIKKFLKSSQPSEIRYLKYTDNFVHKIDMPIKNYDFSKYQNKGLYFYLGYGVFDKKEKNCKYMPLPGISKTDFSAVFDVGKVFNTNNHSYSISRNPMTYAQCKTIASRFGGKIATPGSKSESDFLLEKYGNSKNWLGVFTSGCGEKYKNEEGLTQEYFDWDMKYLKDPSCDPQKLNVSTTRSHSWEKVNQNDQKMCLIEVASKDIYKPIKICTPWWRVEREYYNKPETPSLDAIKLAASTTPPPDEMSICQKYNLKSITERAEESPRITIQCNEYYDATVDPSCVVNPEQDKCYRDGCAWAKNSGNCEKIDEIENPRGYSKGEVSYKDANGNIGRKKIKTRVKDKTYIYNCLKYPPKSEDCLRKAKISIFPKECDGSDCAAQSNCIKSAKTPEAKKECIKNNYCEIVSGNPAILVTENNRAQFNNIEANVNNDGEVMFLYGKCHNPQDQYIKFDFGAQLIKKKKCLEYEKNTEERDVIVKCEMTRESKDYTVLASLTEKDIYENNRSCIRVNTVEEARPKTEIELHVQLPGFEKTIIKKTFIDGKEKIIKEFENRQDIVQEDGSSKNTSLFEDVVKSTDFTESTEKNDIKQVSEDEVCPIGETYLTKMTVMIPRNYNFPKITSFVQDSQNPDIDKKFYLTAKTDTKEDCIDLKDKLRQKKPLGTKPDGYDQLHTDDKDAIQTTYPEIIPNSLEVSFQSTSKTCKIYLDPSDSDKLVKQTTSSPINHPSSEGTSINVTIELQESMSEKKCAQHASCLNGVFEYSSGNCVVKVGPDFPAPKNDDDDDDDAKPVNEEKEIKDCKMAPTTNSVFLDSDGLKDIVSIQETTFGDANDFGWYTNEAYHPFQSNIITSKDGKIVSGQEEIYSVVDQDIKIRGKFLERNKNTKRPPGVLATILSTGLAGGGAAYAVSKGMISSGAGWAIVGVVFVASILFGKRKWYSELRHFWVVYKEINKTRFAQSKYESRKIEDKGDKILATYITNGKEPTGEVKLITKEDGTKEWEGDYIFQKNADGDYVNTTGELREGKQFMRIKSDLIFFRKQAMTCMGWDTLALERLGRNGDFVLMDLEDPAIRYNVQSKKCKWYRPSCTKTKTISEEMFPVSVPKKKNTVFVGATNTLTIIVPYKGAYELTALDKDNEVIGRATIEETSFVPDTAEKMSYAKAFFGKDMNLKVDKPCELSPVAEWGGGVSGIYFENQDADNYSDCSKSDDSYVKEHSAVKIKIRDLRSEKEFIILLEKPMPWANRTFLTTLSQKEIRKYRCYKPFPECQKDDYIIQKDGEQ